jgi:hypothetical protein
MTNTNVRRSDEAPIRSLAASDVVEAIAKRNPKTSRSKIKLAGRVAAALSGVAVRMTSAEQVVLLDNKERLSQLLIEAVRNAMGKVEPKASDVVRAHIEPSRREDSAGTGLGQRIDLKEGRKRVDAYARILPIEEWAGPVLGPGDLETKLRIPRSTLNAWHHRGAVIGLLKGERKHVYPVEQFIDGRPVQGMARLSKVIADERAAWLWLRQPHGLFDDGTPLDQLKVGHIDEVIEAAERDFG